MKLLVQTGILFGICWISQWIEAVLPFPFPASVIGLVLLLVLLLIKAIKLEQIKDVSDFFLGNLPLLFIPAAVSISNYADVILGNLLPFLTICVVSLILTYGVTAWVVNLIVKQMRKKEEKK